MGDTFSTNFRQGLTRSWPVSPRPKAEVRRPWLWNQAPRPKQISNYRCYLEVEKGSMAVPGPVRRVACEFVDAVAGTHPVQFGILTVVGMAGNRHIVAG